MSTVEDDLISGIDKLKATIERLNNEPTKQEYREQVCIETRAVFATFEEVTHWDGVENRVIKGGLIELFSDAVRLLSLDRDSLFDAVVLRLNELKTRDFTATPAAAC